MMPLHGLPRPSLPGGVAGLRLGGLVGARPLGMAPVAGARPLATPGTGAANEVRLIALFVAKFKVGPLKTKSLLAKLTPIRRRFVIQSFKTTETGDAATEALEAYINECEATNAWAGAEKAAAAMKPTGAAGVAAGVAPRPIITRTAGTTGSLLPTRPVASGSSLPTRPVASTGSLLPTRPVTAGGVKRPISAVAAMDPAKRARLAAPASAGASAAVRAAMAAKMAAARAAASRATAPRPMGTRTMTPLHRPGMAARPGVTAMAPARIGMAAPRPGYAPMARPGYGVAPGMAARPGYAAMAARQPMARPAGLASRPGAAGPRPAMMRPQPGGAVRSGGNPGELIRSLLKKM